MKHSEILRKAAALHLPYLCIGVREVCYKYKISYKVKKAICKKIHEYLLGRSTFDTYLYRQTKGASGRLPSYRSPEQEKFIQFLRYKMGMFLADQFEKEGK